LTTLAGHKAADRSLLAATSSHRAPMLHTALHLFLHPFLHLLLPLSLHQHTAHAAIYITPHQRVKGTHAPFSRGEGGLPLAAGSRGGDCDRPRRGLPVAGPSLSLSRTCPSTPKLMSSASGDPAVGEMCGHQGSAVQPQQCGRASTSRVQGPRFRVWGLGPRVWGLGLGLLRLTQEPRPGEKSWAPPESVRGKASLCSADLRSFCERGGKVGGY